MAKSTQINRVAAGKREAPKVTKLRYGSNGHPTPPRTTIEGGDPSSIKDRTAPLSSRLLMLSMVDSDTYRTCPCRSCPTSTIPCRPSTSTTTSPASRIPTKLRRFKYNTSVEIVFQSTALLQSDSNPIHLHGYDFFVLAQGLGNFNPKRDYKKFNYHNPQLRNTVQVPRTGWAAVRFVTDNPGMSYLHCHFEFHIVMGMATAFIVENGPTPETSLPPPPPEFKRCSTVPMVSSAYL
ncbi:hypothetical protein ACP70R_049591 [Stipagrostis hirtigluma subsp. patula]